MLGPVSRFFEGESTSEVGLDAGLRRDFWVSVAPDTQRLDARVKEGDRVFAKADKAGALSAADRDRFLAEALHRPHPLVREQPAAGDVPRCSSRRWSRGSGSARWSSSSAA